LRFGALSLVAAGASLLHLQGPPVSCAPGTPRALSVGEDLGGSMSPFELVFAVFGLLLGLAIAEVLGGFSRAVKLKRGTRPVRVGWL
jgi:hypothetical protein